MKGRGYSHELMAAVERGAKAAGYKKIYLETHTSLRAAIALYEKHGYKSIPQPVPTIHTTMDRFYIKELWYASYRENLRDAYHFS